MKKTTSEKPTLESTINLYKKHLSSLGANTSLEYEIRFSNVQYLKFLEVRKYLGENYKKMIDSDLIGSSTIEPTITMMVSAIKDNKKNNSFFRKDITFHTRTDKTTEYILKKNLIIPYSVKTPNGVNYKITVSSEKIENPITLDETTIVRAKFRLSFPLHIKSSDDPDTTFIWRIDLTIIKEVVGSEVKTSIEKIINYLFKENTLEHFDRVLQELRTMNEIYTYEIEIELVDAIVNGESNVIVLGKIKPIDVMNAIDIILNIKNPEYKNEYQFQEEVYNIAKYIISQQYKLNEFRQESLKRLLPQVISLTKNAYSTLYPPKGLYVTDKADGKRCIVIIRDGIGILMTNNKIIKYTPLVKIDNADCILDTILDCEYIEGDIDLISVKDTKKLISEGDSSISEGGSSISEGGSSISEGGSSISGGGATEGGSSISEGGSSISEGDSSISEGDSSISGGGATEDVVNSISGNLYVFDIIALTGKNISNDIFEKRLEYLESGVEIVNTIFGANFAKVKLIYLIENDSPEYLEKIIRQSYEEEKPYKKDGLIFIENGKSYKLTSSYKWKSRDDTTIDFLVKKAPRELLGIYPYENRTNSDLYILFVGIKTFYMNKLGINILPHYTKIFKKNISENPLYMPIQFTPADVPYAYIYYHPKSSKLDINNKIVEFKCGGDCAAAGGGALYVDWEIVRIREDREESKTYYGNDFQVAESTWSNNINPFSMNELWEQNHSEYFKTVKGKQYESMVKVMNYVKGEIITSISHCDWVLDIGAGKGQDLGRYFNAKIKHLIAIDQDRAALTTLIERRQSFIKQKRTDHQKKYTSVYIIVSDINHDDSEVVVRKCNILGMGMCNAIVCNLAFHYFLGTSESINNFIEIAFKTVAINGQVCITCFNGASIHKIFTDNNITAGNSWDLREDGIIKYSLMRKYSSKKLESCGQQIGVFLPFSMGEYYDEYLFNEEYISKEFKKKHFALKEIHSVGEYFSIFETKDKRTFELLTEADKIYLPLYHKVIYERTK
jgi:hypothetical protein